MSRLERRGAGDDGDNDDGGGDDDGYGDEASPESPAYALVQGTIEKHLRLDSAAAAAVTLLPDPSAPHQYGSLYDVLNRLVAAAARQSRGTACGPFTAAVARAVVVAGAEERRIVCWLCRGVVAVTGSM